MKGIVNFIDNNYGLLDNHIFLSICWNMIYAANSRYTFDISFLSELKVPSPYCFSYLGNKLDFFYQQNDAFNFIKYNPCLVTRFSHLELYNLVYYSDLKCDGQQNFFFKSGMPINRGPLNYLGRNEFYKIQFNCGAYNKSNIPNNIISFGFIYNHPFFIDDFGSDIIKMRAITHKPPIGSIFKNIENTNSYIMNYVCDVPRSFIKSMTIIDEMKTNKTFNDLRRNFFNSDLVNMPSISINPLKLAITYKYNYSEPIIPFRSNTEDNIDYLNSFNDLENKLNNNSKYMSDFNKEKHKLTHNINKIWK